MHAVGRQSVGHVVDTDHQEQFARLSGQDLVEASVDAHHLVADDTAVYHVFPSQPFAPVASVFGQAVAQHYDIVRRRSIPASAGAPRCVRLRDARR